MMEDSKTPTADPLGDYLADMIRQTAEMSEPDERRAVAAALARLAARRNGTGD